MTAPCHLAPHALRAPHATHSSYALFLRTCARHAGRWLAALSLAALAACGGGGGDGGTTNIGGGQGGGQNGGGTPPTTVSPRGIAVPGPWVAYYNTAGAADLPRMASTFRLMVLDLDPGLRNFSPAQVTQLKAGGNNRVLSYLNIGACEQFRSYWSTAPAGIVSCNANTSAKRGAYSGFPNEVWMSPGNADYQKLILEHVAPGLVAMGADGFYLDNMEIVQHSATASNGPCDATCRQGGLDLIRKLREKYPDLTIVMQNALEDVTLQGMTGGVRFASLLDGVAGEGVFAPTYSAYNDNRLGLWRDVGFKPGGQAFWVGTLDYVGNCTDRTAANSVMATSSARGFSPYVSDSTHGLQDICYW
ncbi:endo alpha-1,4 polygalactosaminidase [Imbroritus primus]|uniref:endo alpha-1,4 polygalactosaminidase n=1 Tax=Imbroritus primus TaxID=3058603 RepID=UPI003D161BB1